MFSCKMKHAEGLNIFTAKYNHQPELWNTYLDGTRAWIGIVADSPTILQILKVC